MSTSEKRPLRSEEGGAQRGRARARADALADYGETIPPLAKRLPRLPVAFAQFLADSVKEYY